MSNAIQYQVRSALTTEQKNAGLKIPMASTRGRLTETDLAREIIRQGTTVREADVLAVLKNISNAVAARCKNGESVTIPSLGIITPRIGGVMDKDGKWIDGPYVYLGMKFETALAEDIQLNATIEQISVKKNMPQILRFFDAASATENTTATMDSAAEINGLNLRFNPTKSDEGLWLAPVNPELPAVKVGAFLQNSPSRVIFTVPAGLQIGTLYKPLLRARAPGCKLLRESTTDVTVIGA